MRNRALALYRDGHSFRAIARQLSVGPQTVINWVNAEEMITETAL
jgi:transposase